MPYQLLTGATGLLGNYLLRDLLRTDRQVAVVVRPNRVETARQRIESILARWEQSLGRTLPRPPVLEGDICQADLGLNREALDWVAAHCGSVIHNAASLSFDADEKTGEPERSNIEGTRNVLELCRRAGIRQFHHVSTAYVCGLRTGRVLEDELDVGQRPGNAYEKSKIAAEKLVRGATWLDAPTVYRPAIIIGDSATGYTTTFHGFYTPLKIVQAFADRGYFTEIDASPMLAALDLKGHERKNFVPVDWISRVIAWLSGRAEHHGRTYHLTPRRAVPMSVTCEAMEQVLREYIQTQRPVQAPGPDFEALVQNFIEQMETYRAYWRDDPDFDRARVEELAPHLECPEVDRQMLVRTARYALQTNFGWPRPQPVRPPFDVADHFEAVSPATSDSQSGRRGRQQVGLQINGPGGGQWTLVVDGGRVVERQWGLTGERQALMYLNSNTFQRCVRGELTVEQARERGLLNLEGPLQQNSTDLLNLLQAVTCNGTAREQGDNTPAETPEPLTSGLS